MGVMPASIQYPVASSQKIQPLLELCPMKPRKHITPLLGFAGIALVTTVVLAANQAPKSQGPSPKPASGPIRVRVSTPPLPTVGYAPVRPMDVVRATYDFA